MRFHGVCPKNKTQARQKNIFSTVCQKVFRVFQIQSILVYCEEYIKQMCTAKIQKKYEIKQFTNYNIKKKQQ